MLVGKSVVDIFIFLACNTVLVHAWNTIYDLEGGHVYLQLKNNDIIKVDFSMDGTVESDIKEDTKLSPFCSAPGNSSLFLQQGELYGFVSAPPKRQTKSKDICGSGLLNLQKLDKYTKKWNTVQLDSGAFDELDDASYYQCATYLAAESSTLYIYGGLCLKSEEITNRLISFDFNKKTFANISTSTKPQPFYGAASIHGPDSQTQLVIGGQTNQGWLNMYQLATWNFESGWSFKSVGTGKDKINSRKFALTLPLFGPLSNSSLTEIELNYAVDSVLLIGGETLSEQSTPPVSKLTTSDARWAWQAVDLDIDTTKIMGAATIFNTLIVISQEMTKREEGYVVTLYDTDTLKKVSSLKDNYSSKYEPDNKSDLVHKKAILGTILPVAAIAAAVAAAAFVIKRRKARSQAEEEEIDYHFGNFYDQNNAHPYNNGIAADSNSTLDGALIDSWVRKRQQYEEKRNKLHNDHWTSKDTLTSHEYDEANGVPEKPLPTPLQGSVLNRSMSKVKGTFSFTNTPSSPRIILSPKNLTGPRTLRERASENTLASTNGNIFDDEMSSEEDGGNNQHKNYESDGSLDEMVDVQVLVSSKRRSVLKVMNPDLELAVEKDTDVRQRVPSDESNKNDEED